MDEQDYHSYLKVMRVSEVVSQAMMKSKKKGGARSCNSEIFKNICILALSHKFESTNDMKVWVNVMVDKCKDTNGNITLAEKSRSSRLC